MKNAIRFNISALLTVAALTASPALAQSVPQSAYWTGAYISGGIGLGKLDINVPAGRINDEVMINGITAGYDYDLGNWVIGGNFAIDALDANLSGTNASLDRLWRVGVTGGYKIGNGLLCATGGFANAETGHAKNDEGFFIGGRYEYLVQANFSVGGEVLYHQFDNFKGTRSNYDVMTYQIRGILRL
jgi:hypothetical protein